MEEIQQIGKSVMLLYEKELYPIEIFMILFYSEKLMDTKKYESIYKLYKPYIPSVFDYIYKNYEFIKNNELEECLLDWLQEDKIYNFIIKIHQYMVRIYGKEVKNIFNNIQNEKNKIFNLINKNTISDNEKINILLKLEEFDTVQLKLQKIFTIEIEKIFRFFVYYEHKDKIADVLNNIYDIERETVIQIFESYKNSINPYDVIIELKNKINTTIDLEDFLIDITKNSIKTIYTQIDEIEQEIKVVRDKIISTRNALLSAETSNYINKVINKVKEKIIERVDDLIEDQGLDIDINLFFNDIVQEEICKNRLNLSSEINNMLVEYYKTTKFKLISKIESLKHKI